MRSMQRQKVPFKLDSLCGHVSTTHSSVLFVGKLYCKETILLLLGRKFFLQNKKVSPTPRVEKALMTVRLMLLQSDWMLTA